LDEYCVEYLNFFQNKVSVFEHQEGKWKKTRAKEIRLLSTMIMDELEKDNLIKDINEFLDKPTQK
jgi:chaperone BCS1